jgi:hypothetical protein
MKSQCVFLSAVVLAVVDARAPPPAWAFLDRYPQHYAAVRAAAPITIDGDVSDGQWAEAEWSDGSFGDIKQWLQDTPLNTVTEGYECKIKFMWDDDYLYVAAMLNEPMVTATTGTGSGKPSTHNVAPAPYEYDNDFEVFVDPSRSTQFYKEYEMHAGNSTYDVLWGVPDRGQGLQCGGKFTPPCQNTSFNKGQTWTMAGPAGGLKTATRATEGEVGEFRPGGGWVVEIAFPIHGFDAVSLLSSSTDELAHGSQPQDLLSNVCSIHRMPHAIFLPSSVSTFHAFSRGRGCLTAGS